MVDGPDVAEVDLYAVLGVSRTAKDLEIRRAYRNLITREHPDKGGDADRFTLIQRAYDVLGNDSKRKQYDETGRLEKTVDEEFMDTFGGGAFRDKARQQQVDRESMAEQLAVRQSDQFQSHTAGFEAWMRSRGDSVTTFTAENAADQFGVVKSSYEAVPLPNIRAYQARCKAFGKPKESLELICEAIPQALEWGEVLVSMRAAPVNPGDLYDVQTGGGTHLGSSGEVLKTPFVGGNDGIGVVVKVGPGVKNLQVRPTSTSGIISLAEKRPASLGLRKAPPKNKGNTNEVTPSLSLYLSLVLFVGERLGAAF